jgi:hypothetical protein
MCPLTPFRGNSLGGTRPRTANRSLIPTVIGLAFVRIRTTEQQRPGDCGSPNTGDDEASLSRLLRQYVVRWLSLPKKIKHAITDFEKDDEVPEGLSVLMREDDHENLRPRIFSTSQKLGPSLYDALSLHFDTKYPVNIQPILHGCIDVTRDKMVTITSFRLQH